MLISHRPALPILARSTINDKPSPVAAVRASDGVPRTPSQQTTTGLVDFESWRRLASKGQRAEPFSEAARLRNKITTQYPASWFGAKWRDALPSGNGVIAAAVYGGVHNETVLVTHDDLWHEVVTAELPDVSDHLAQTRRLLLENKAFEADRVLSDALKGAGYKADIGAPLPLGDLKIEMPVNRGFADYRRTLDMETGEVTVRWKDGEFTYSRKLFVSRADDLIVMELRCTGANRLSAKVTLDLHDRADARLGKGNDPELPRDVAIHATAGGYVRYAARNNDDGLDFGAVARVVSAGGTVTVEGDAIHVSGGSTAMVIVKPFIKGDRERDWPSLERELAAVAADYAALLGPHVELHRELFSRVTLDLGASAVEHERSNETLLLDAYQGEVSTAMVEKMWAYGRYLLISSSRVGGQPCPLQGKWCGSYRGYWTFNMANENLQMNYWQAMSGNLTETVLPVFDYYDRMMEDSRENARKIYGCRGICVACITTPPSGLFKDIQPHILHWTGAGAWVGQHYYDYYHHTNDEEFLRERVMPFLREVAAFYDDFFTIGEDGYFVSAPSNSPENSPGNHRHGGSAMRSMETTMNATMDFALAKEVLTHLIEGASILGEAGDDVDHWRQMLSKIPPYQINEDGAVREWMHPFYTDNYHHRHQSHIYPVFPGTEITRESDPALFNAFEIAIRKRLEIGLTSQTGWSLAHMANVYARMGEGDQALDVLGLLARSCVMNNFYTTHNDWRESGIGVSLDIAPFQIDANLGWTAAVQEMLLFSVPGTIHVLPALPTAWKKGSASGLLARGGVEVSVAWDQADNYVKTTLRAVKRDQSVNLRLPYGRQKTQTLELKAGEPVTVDTRPPHAFAK